MPKLFLAGQIIFGTSFILMGVFQLLQLENMARLARFKGVPMAKTSVALGGLFLILAGLSITTGFEKNYTLWALIIFVSITTIIFHRFWEDRDPMEKLNNFVNVLKNLALIGAMLILLGTSS